MEVTPFRVRSWVVVGSALVRWTMIRSPRLAVTVLGVNFMSAAVTVTSTVRPVAVTPAVEPGVEAADDPTEARPAAAGSRPTPTATATARAVTPAIRPDADVERGRQRPGEDGRLLTAREPTPFREAGPRLSIPRGR